MTAPFKAVAVGAFLGALVAQAGACLVQQAGASAQTARVAKAQPKVKPTPTPEAPAPEAAPLTPAQEIVLVTPLRRMGRTLMECRVKLAAQRCKEPGPLCDAARAALGGSDGIFNAIAEIDWTNWTDVLGRVDEAVSRCEFELRGEYKRYDWTGGEDKR